MFVELGGAAQGLGTAVLAWLGTYLIHSTLLLCAAWGLCTLLTRWKRNHDALPAVREGLWRVALLGGLATASVQQFVERPAHALVWTLDAAPSAQVVQAAQAPIETAPAAAHHPAAALAASPVLLHPAPRVAPSEQATAPRAAGQPATPPAAPPALEMARPEPERAAVAASWDWPRTLLGLWLAGCLLGALAWAREWIALHRSLRRRVLLDRGPVYDVFRDLCQRTNTHGVRLTAAPGLSAPITLGLWNNEIVVPPRVASQLALDELEGLFAHELAHARRGDPLWLVIYRALEVAFFFQPLNRIASTRLSDEAELLADDWAMTQLPSRVSLASCLTEIAGWIVDERRRLPAPAMAAPGTRLTLRVRRLLDEEHRPERARRPHGLLILAGLAATGVALFAPGLSTGCAAPATVHVVCDCGQGGGGTHQCGEAEDCADETACEADESCADEPELLYLTTPQLEAPEPTEAADAVQPEVETWIAPAPGVDGQAYTFYTDPFFLRARTPERWTYARTLPSTDWQELHGQLEGLREEAEARETPCEVLRRLDDLEEQLDKLQEHCDELAELLSELAEDEQPEPEIQ